MVDRYQRILNGVRSQYLDVNFGIIEEDSAIKFLCDDAELVDNAIFFDFVCSVAYENLIGDELNIFSITYDYFSDLVTQDIVSKVYSEARYKCDINKQSFIFNINYTQSLNGISEEALAA